MSVSTNKLLLAGLVAAGLQLGSSDAEAFPCGGFVDSDSTRPDFVGTDFCLSIDWIKNRGVTTGCGPNLYCPDANVTRAQMAAFLQRIGTVLSPKLTSLESDSGAINLDAGPTPRVCITDNIDPAPVPPATLPGKPYPRRAIIHSTFSGQAAGALDYRTDLQFSTDNGVSWDFVWTNFVNRDGSSGAHWVSSSQTGALDLDPNLDYKFAFLVQRQTSVPVSTADFSASRCFITVEVFSRTGSSSPFDSNRVKLPNADH